MVQGSRLLIRRVHNQACLQFLNRQLVSRTLNHSAICCTYFAKFNLLSLSFNPCQFVLINNFILCMLPLIFILNFKQEHIASCKFKKIPCPNKQYGCTKLLLQNQWEEHLERECRFIPVQSPWCSKKVHNKEVSNFTERSVKINNT